MNTETKALKYSDELVSEVRALYPDSPTIIRMALEGDYFLGRYLDDASDGKISVDTILIATSLEKLKDLALHEKKKAELYQRWFNETDAIRG